MIVLIKFIIGGLIYMGIEVMYDNTSDRSMGLVGGLAFVICTSIVNAFNFDYWVNCFIIASVITVLEYVGGMIFNRDYSIWDYRKMPFNFQGQICLPFYLIWLVAIAPMIIYLDKIIIIK